MDAPTSPERTRREGVEALSIPMADGHRWGLALPSPRIRPEVIEGVDPLGRPSTTIRLVSEFGYPLEIRGLIDDLRSACDRGDSTRQFEALIRLAAALICRAHEIDLKSAVSLLEMGVDELPGLVEAVLSVVSGSCPAEPGALRKGKSMADPRDARGNRASREKVEAVSGALMAGKSLLDRPPSPAKINFPDVARSIGDLGRGPDAVAAPASKIEGPSITIDPARVDLPESDRADRSEPSESIGEEATGPGPTSGGHQSRSGKVDHAPTPAGRSIPTASLPVKTAVTASDAAPTVGGGPSAPSSVVGIDRPSKGISGTSDRPEGRTVAASRSSSPIASYLEGGGSRDLGGLGEPPPRPDAAPASGQASRPDPVRVGESRPPLDLAHVAVPARVAPVSAVGPREGGGVRTPESPTVATVPNATAGVAPPATMADRPNRSTNLAAPSMSFVRNPLSSGLADFSMSGPGSSGQGGPASGPGGIEKGPGEPSSGGATSPQAGATGDLSRTNELLQQLIDAVRKQRGASLPPGGPPVYADR